MKVLIIILLLLGKSLVVMADSASSKFLRDVPELSKLYEQEEKFNKIKSKSKVKVSLSDREYEKQAEIQGQEFEAMFVAEMMRHMHSGLNPDPLFGGGSSEKTFQDMLNGERSKFIDLGIAKMIKEQLIELRKRNVEQSKYR